MEMRRVAVTGLGAVTGYGVGVELLVDSMFAGQTCIRRITNFDPSPFDCQIGAQICDYDGSVYFRNPRDARRLESNIVLGVTASRLALDDAKLVITEELKPRIGTYIGSGIGGLITLQNEIYHAHEKGAQRLSPFFIPNALSNMPAGVISMEAGSMGPCYSVVSACASSGHSLGEAMQAIQLGQADAMIAGGTERALCEIGLGGFCSMKAVTADFNDAPEKSSRPFDAKRSGFVMGEGAAIYILEAWEHAVARGARIYAELVGYGASSDAHHITAPAPEGAGAQLAMRNCLEYAGVAPEQVGYINAHGTSTPLNDKCESQAIRHVFGAHADKLLVSSTKSVHGHMLGAAAAIEGIACIYALLRGEAPPTINYEYPDPECDLNYVPNKAQPFSGDYAMCNTFGFGGQNAVLLFKRAV